MTQRKRHSVVCITGFDFDLPHYMNKGKHINFPNIGKTELEFTNNQKCSLIIKQK